MKKLLLAFVILTGTAGAADVVDTLNTATTEFRDNWMWEDNPSILINNGAHGSWNIGQQATGANREFRTWFWFDQTALSQYGNIDSVVACTLVVTVGNALGASRDSLWVYRMKIRINPAWEGNNTGGSADSGEMAWQFRMEYPPTGPSAGDSLWFSGAATGPTSSNNDFYNRILGAKQVAGQSAGTVLRVGLDRAAIDTTVTEVQDNNGYLVVANNSESDNTRTEFWSSDNATASDRPLLLIWYDTVGAAAPAVLNIGSVGISPGHYGPNQ